MGSGYVCRWRALATWVVLVALFAGAVGGAVLLPVEGVSAQSAAPAAAGGIPGVELTVGDAARAVGVTDYFTGSVASYRATSADIAVVSVSVSGSTVTLTPEGAGSTSVTVAASNTAGSATQTFTAKVIPAGCVVALGTLTAGPIVTQNGSWERDDGCRATNDTSTAHDRYARYVSFTVTEPLEAWFHLTSSQANRLYLLEGTGTGGRVLYAAGTAGATWVAWLRPVLAPGTYTLETSTHRAAREAAFSISIDSMPLSPPASCVVSLGAISAGTTITHSAAWDRDDACRSVNATTNQTSRYYAGYVSFTVAEPLEARFRLSSTQGTRLYLLEGTGTGGRVLASSSARYGTSAAALRRVLAPGTYTLETTTYRAAREAAYTLSASSAVSAPTRGDPLEAQEIQARHAAAQIDVSAAFGGIIDTYTATSSDTSILTASVNGSVLTLNGVTAGTATVTVTAANTAGRAEQSFAVTVRPATAPQATGTLAAQTLTAGDSIDVDVASAFTGTVETYVVTSSNAAVVDVALAGSTITLSGVAAGTATVTVTATNTAGSATQTLTVTVNLPPAPTLGAQLAAQALQVTETLTIDIAAGFNGRIDTYTAVSGDTDKLTATVDGPNVTLTGAAAGSTTITVTAINAAGRAARSFNVTVSALAAPQTAGTPIARTIAVGEELPIHIADAFTGIVHTYGATSSDTTIATASIDGSTVTLRGVAAGTATVTLVATNTAGSATATFTAPSKSPNNSPSPSPRPPTASAPKAHSRPAADAAALAISTSPTTSPAARRPTPSPAPTRPTPPPNPPAPSPSPAPNAASTSPPPDPRPT